MVQRGHEVNPLLGIPGSNGIDLSHLGSCNLANPEVSGLRESQVCCNPANPAASWPSRITTPSFPMSPEGGTTVPLSASSVSKTGQPSLVTERRLGDENLAVFCQNLVRNGVFQDRWARLRWHVLVPEGTSGLRLQNESVRRGILFPQPFSNLLQQRSAC